MHAVVNCVMCNVCGSTHSSGRVVNGSFAMAAPSLGPRPFPSMRLHKGGVGRGRKCLATQPSLARGPMLECRCEC